MFSFLAWSICHSSLCCWLCFINVLHVQNSNQTNGLLSLAYNSSNGKFLLIFPRFRFVDLLLMLPCPSTMAHIYALCGEKNATLFIIFGWKWIHGLCRQLLRSKWGIFFLYKIQTSDGIKKRSRCSTIQMCDVIISRCSAKTPRKKSNENNDKTAHFCDANPHQNLIKWIHIIGNSNAIRKTHEK